MENWYHQTYYVLVRELLLLSFSFCVFPVTRSLSDFHPSGCGKGWPERKPHLSVYPSHPSRLPVPCSNVGIPAITRSPPLEGCLTIATPAKSTHNGNLRIVSIARLLDASAVHFAATAFMFYPIQSEPGILPCSQPLIRNMLCPDL